MANLDRFYPGWVAQSVEHRTHKPVVAGSIPAPATKKNRNNRFFLIYLMERNFTSPLQTSCK
jgi:hypothetical protein